MSSDSEIAGGPPERAIAPARRPCGTHGGLCVVAIVASSEPGAPWQQRGGMQQRLPAGWDVGKLVVALALTSQWTFAAASDDPPAACEGLKFMRGEALRASRAAVSVCGFIENPIIQVACLDEPVELEGRMATQVCRDLYVADASATFREPGRPGADFQGGLRAGLEGWKCPPLTPVLFLLAPLAAFDISQGVWSVLNVVAVTARLKRQSLLHPSWPTAREIASLRRHHGDFHVKRLAARAPLWRLPRWARLMTDPQVVLDWLEASSFLKDSNKTAEAIPVFAQLLARKHPDIAASDLTHKLEQVHQHTLRRARVRLDFVCLLLCRQLYRQTLQNSSLEDISFHLFADASPQWRGAEIFCSSLDMRVGDLFQRRMLPLLQLHMELMDTLGKAVALMWQILLSVGPSFTAFRTFCRNVRSITTDLGVERLIVDLQNVSQEFFVFVDPKARQHDDNDEHLFPRAVCMPGWKHMCDGLVRYGLFNLVWFPGWLVLISLLSSLFSSLLSFA